MAALATSPSLPGSSAQDASRECTSDQKYLILLIFNYGYNNHSHSLSGAVAGLVFASPPADAVDKLIQHVKSDGSYLILFHSILDD